MPVEQEMPTWDQVRDACNRAAADRGEWAGAPLPIDRLRLVISKKYKFQGLNGFRLDDGTNGVEEIARRLQEVLCPLRVRNIWYSQRLRGEVAIFEEGGKLAYSLLPEDWPGKRVNFLINTVGASRAWSFAAEIRAQAKLRDLVGEHKFSLYVMTGAFLETSERSHVTYIFRRLRPTLAIRASGPDDSKILAALCLHPIGHYEESFAGVMVPTDDVIAHLLLMRADEHGFWKKANHHNLFSASSGI